MINERVNDDIADRVCLIGQGHRCCRYIGMGPEGWSCLKTTEMRVYLDNRVKNETMGARGDNCEGRLP